MLGTEPGGAWHGRSLLAAMQQTRATSGAATGAIWSLPRSYVLLCKRPHVPHHSSPPRLRPRLPQQQPQPLTLGFGSRPTLLGGGRHSPRLLGTASPPRSTADASPPAAAAALVTAASAQARGAAAKGSLDAAAAAAATAAAAVATAAVEEGCSGYNAASSRVAGSGGALGSCGNSSLRRIQPCPPLYPAPIRTSCRARRLKCCAGVSRPPEDGDDERPATEAALLRGPGEQQPGERPATEPAVSGFASRLQQGASGEGGAARGGEEMTGAGAEAGGEGKGGEGQERGPGQQGQTPGRPPFSSGQASPVAPPGPSSPSIPDRAWPPQSPQSTAAAGNQAAAAAASPVVPSNSNLLPTSPDAASAPSPHPAAKAGSGGGGEGGTAGASAGPSQGSRAATQPSPAAPASPTATSPTSPPGFGLPVPPRPAPPPRPLAASSPVRSVPAPSLPSSAPSRRPSQAVPPPPTPRAPVPLVPTPPAPSPSPGQGTGRPAAASMPHTSTPDERPGPSLSPTSSALVTPTKGPASPAPSPSPSRSAPSPSLLSSAPAPPPSPLESDEAPQPNPEPPLGPLAAAQQRLQEVWTMLQQAVDNYLNVWDRWYMKLLLTLGLLGAVISAAVNLVVVPTLNAQVVPGWRDKAQDALCRKVELGRIHDVSLLGVTGLVPLVRVGPVLLGSGPVEQSRLYVPELALYLDPLRSLLSKQAMLQVHLEQPEALIIQGNTYGWFGFPEDTVPSSRDVLPGLSGEGGGGGVSSSGDAGGGGSNSNVGGGDLGASGSSYGAGGGGTAGRGSNSGNSVAATAAETGGGGTVGRGSSSFAATAAEAGGSDVGVGVSRQAVRGAGRTALASLSLSRGQGSTSSPTISGTGASSATANCNSRRMDTSNTQTASGSFSAATSSASNSHTDTNAAAAEFQAGAGVMGTGADALLLEQVSASSSAWTSATWADHACAGSAWADHAWRRAAETQVLRWADDAAECVAAGLGEALRALVRQQQLLQERQLERQLQREQRWRQKLSVRQVRGRQLQTLQQPQQPQQPLQHQLQQGQQPPQQQLRQQQQHEELQQRRGALPASAATALTPTWSHTSTPSAPPSLLFALSRSSASAPSIATARSSPPLSLNPNPNPNPSPIHSVTRPVLSNPTASHNASRSASQAPPSPATPSLATAERGPNPPGLPPPPPPLLPSPLPPPSLSPASPSSPGLASLPPVALGRLSLRNACVGVLVLGDSEPRWFEYLNGELLLSRGYGDIELRMSADVHERPAAQARLTMISPHAKRHLRHVTPGANGPWANATSGPGAGAPRLFGCDLLPKGMVAEGVTADGKLAVPAAAAAAVVDVEGEGQRVESRGSGQRDGPRYGRGSDQEKQPWQQGRGEHVGTSEVSHPDRPWSAVEWRHHDADAGSVGGTVRTGPAVQRYLYSENMRSSKDGMLRQRSFGVLPPARVKAGRTREGEGGVTDGKGGTQQGKVQAAKQEQKQHAGGNGKEGQGQQAAEKGKEGQGPQAQQERKQAGQQHTAGRQDGAKQEGDKGKGKDAAFVASVAAAPAAAKRPLRRPALQLEMWRGGATPPWMVSGAERQRPSGGHVSVHLTNRGMNIPDRCANLLVTIQGSNLHGPLIERLIELPMDIHEGRVTGEFKVKSYDSRTWWFPEILGHVRCSGAALHFWDAPDDILAADMDLVFERDRMYLHGAQGHFGAVPLRITGDMDLNPETGTYRLSATVPGVEVNALRATLGVRPVPAPVMTAVRGVLHLTGPLERPVFSGSAVATRPPPDMLQGAEATPALLAMLAEPQAVGAYERVPLLAASGVFTLDMSTEVFTLHSAQVQPVGGGQVVGSGRMWVAPEAETHPQAISIRADAAGVDADLLLRYFLPPDAPTLPEPFRVGKATGTVTMSGSHLAPEVQVSFAAPLSGLTGSAHLMQDAILLSARGPALSADLAARISTPLLEHARQADTQAEATAFSQPRFEGGSLSLSFGTVDVAPLLATEGAAPADPVAGGPPLRARIAGSCKASLAPVSRSGSETSGGWAGEGEGGGPLFQGPIQLSGVRLNQLGLVKQLSGTIGLAADRLSIAAVARLLRAWPRGRGPGRGWGQGRGLLQGLGRRGWEQSWGLLLPHPNLPAWGCLQRPSCRCPRPGGTVTQALLLGRGRGRGTGLAWR